MGNAPNKFNKLIGQRLQDVRTDRRITPSHYASGSIIREGIFSFSVGELYYLEPALLGVGTPLVPDRVVLVPDLLAAESATAKQNRK